MDTKRPSHPERPDRVSNIWDTLEKAGCVGRCTRVESREATKEELLLVHNDDVIEMIKGCGSATDAQLHELAMKHDSVYFSRGTYNSAVLAAGCTTALTELVCDGQLRNGIAVVRPPGHHAETTCPRGFSFFNSVAIAAKVALKRENINRILIIDWDVHHGNGIQNVFYDDPRVLYCSLHRYDNAAFYPGSPDANYDMVGTNKGAGFNINVAWNWSNMGDSDYMGAFHQLIMPVAYEFNPDLVLVACGLDAARGDPLGRYNITPEGYAHITHQLCGLAEGRIVLALEGGYNLTSIARSMTAICHVLLGDALPRLEDHVIINDNAQQSITSTISAIAPYWKCLKHHFKPDNTDSSNDQTQESIKREESEPYPPTNVDQPQQQREAEPHPPANVETAASSNAMEDVNELLQQLELAGHTRVFAVQPVPFCPHLSDVQPLPSDQLDARQPCGTCGDTSENWMCLVCYQVYCGRYVKQHMLEHEQATNHTMVLSLADLSVWCYPCEEYVHNKVVFRVIDAIHVSKFGRHANLSS